MNYSLFLALNESFDEDFIYLLTPYDFYFCCFFSKKDD